MKKQTLQDVFQDDPEMLRVLELREQTELLRQIADKKVSLEGIEQIKGEKGDDGYTPIKGVDYLTDEELQAIKEEATPVKGVHYFDGEKGDRGNDGINGIDGINGKDGIDGISYSKQDMMSLISELLQEMEAKDFGAVSEKEVKEILKKHHTAATNKLAQDLANLRGDVMRNYGGHGGSGSGKGVLAYDLSASLDGSTKIFTIPGNSAIVQITSSSVPFVFRPTVDFTGGGTTTLTFAAGVDAPSMLAAGQSMIVLYVPS